MNEKIAVALKPGAELEEGSVIVGIRGGEAVSILRLVELDEVYSRHMRTHRRFDVHVIWAKDPVVVERIKSMLIENLIEYRVVVPAVYAELELDDPRVIEM